MVMLSWRIRVYPQSYTSLELGKKYQSEIGDPYVPFKYCTVTVRIGIIYICYEMLTPHPKKIIFYKVKGWAYPGSERTLDKEIFLLSFQHKYFDGKIFLFHMTFM